MKKKYTCPLSFHDLVNSSTPLHSNYATGMQIILERVYNKKEKNNGKKAAARSQCTDATNTKPSHQTRRVHKISVNLGDLGVVHFTVLPKTFSRSPLQFDGVREGSRRPVNLGWFHSVVGLSSRWVGPGSEKL